MREMKVLFPVLALCLFAPASVLNDPASPCQVRVGMETGFIGVLANEIQFGRTGTMFDYVKEGGQDNLYPFRRMTAELSVRNRHSIVFLAQPLDLRTTALLLRDAVVDSLTFLAGTPMDLRYGFDFYRLSYLFDLLPGTNKELSVGASFQIRNATITFASQDGRLFRRVANIGPVPVLKVRAQWPIRGRSWLGAEIDGFYATDRFFNGANFKFEGSILDASVRCGLKLNESLAGFINWRFLGGGAKGQGSDPPGPSDGYTDNALGTTSVTLGFYLE